MCPVYNNAVCRHHNKFLDLSNLFRYTNLPQNAKMEMVATDKRRTESMTQHFWLVILSTVKICYVITLQVLK